MLLRTILLFVFFALLFRAGLRLLSGIVGGAAGPSSVPPRRPASPPAVKMSQCPVCGTYVVPGKSVSGVFKGETVYFCSDKCRQAFAA